MNRLARWLLAGLCLLPLVAQSGEARERLEHFLDETRTLRADFVQVQTGEQRAGPQRARGELLIARPGRFRWDYREPYRQLILADGERLWIYDPDLEQVTVRPQREALGSSPAQLLTGVLDLDERFTIDESGRGAEGLQWLTLKPVGNEDEFTEVRLGFAAEGLRAMHMTDALGNVTEIEFSHVETNVEVDEERFRFTPPEGVDVVGE